MGESETRSGDASGDELHGIVGAGRLDRSLAEQCPTLSRERIKALIADGKLIVAGRIVSDTSTRKFAGARFVLTVPPAAPMEAQAEAIPLDVVFEDKHLIVIDKPAGLVVHPAPGHSSGTLVNALLHHCEGQLSGIGGVERPGIVHRIDAATSGLMVAAKSAEAHEGLSALFASHDIDRLYRAIVSGMPSPSSGTITGAIGRHPRDRKKMAVVDEGRGKSATTHYRTLKTARSAALVECRLETGRTHQVRVHMAHIGHSLIGDPLYGKRRKARQIGPVEAEFTRQALHAAVLGFIHPVTGENLRFESQIPCDMQELLSEIFV